MYTKFQPHLLKGSLSKKSFPKNQNNFKIPLSKKKKFGYLCKLDYFGSYLKKLSILNFWKKSFKEKHIYPRKKKQ